MTDHWQALAQPHPSLPWESLRACAAEVVASPDRDKWKEAWDVYVAGDKTEGENEAVMQAVYGAVILALAGPQLPAAVQQELYLCTAEEMIEAAAIDSDSALELLAGVQVALGPGIVPDAIKHLRGLPADDTSRYHASECLVTALNGPEAIRAQVEAFALEVLEQIATGQRKLNDVAMVGRLLEPLRPPAAMPLVKEILKQMDEAAEPLPFYLRSEFRCLLKELQAQTPPTPYKIRPLEEWAQAKWEMFQAWLHKTGFFAEKPALPADELDDDIFGERGDLKPFRNESEKVGRNDPCPCGSGKKYKKCCGP